MNITNFEEGFASGVLRRNYQNAVYPAITNKQYEGELKRAGDRLNILSFLNSGELQDYAVGTDMAIQQIIDAEDQLIVEKRKAYNISLDRLEDLFTYATDIPDYLLNEQAKVLERTTDAYVLDKFGSEVKAGNWLGVDFYIAGASYGTSASIVTTATGGTITVNSTGVATVENSVGAVENPRDGGTYFAGFQNSDLYKGVRLVSTAAFVTPWYRISSVTSSTVATITEWDEATSGPDFEEGYTLRGTFGGDGVNFPKGGNGDSLIGQMGLGWEFQAAIPTAVTAATIYDQVTILNQFLDENEVQSEDRHMTGTPAIVTQLRQASELQPTGIAEIYSGTVLNGKVMRIGSLDVHVAAGSRVSTRSGKNPGSGVANDVVFTAATTGYILPVNHIGFMTYADKWTESRVVDSINQFAKQYQGLYLFGAKVPRIRRKSGAVLFGSL